MLCLCLGVILNTVSYLSLYDITMIKKIKTNIVNRIINCFVSVNNIASNHLL